MRGEGGTVFVAGASVPGAGNGRPGGGGGGSTNGPGGPGGFTNTPRAWSTNAPAIPPQITIALEDYNRMVRMIQQGEHLKMAVDLQVKFYGDDLMAYNTVAEIPGTDLKDQVVMLGAHLDSWHAGTGATDNGVGVAATMEAMRILSALKLQPRRTIRIGLWSGEEQGLLGSKAYVADHFGYYTNGADRGASGTLRGEARDGSRASALLRQTEEPDSDSNEKSKAESGTNAPPRRHLIRQRDYEKLSAYFNLDNGAGKIRGVHLQGNEAVRPLFRRWLTPFADLGADTLTLSNTGSTDHMSFDAIGLPGFQFIQDPLDYMTRTHHSNEDVFDRIQADDLKQAAIVLAAFAYDAAMLDEPLPRKPLAEPAGPRRLE
jgi:Zn-dependent M28 family amino/carboxypeptidase